MVFRPKRTGTCPHFPLDTRNENLPGKRIHRKYALNKLNSSREFGLLPPPACVVVVLVATALIVRKRAAILAKWAGAAAASAAAPVAST
jgi:hypothetical protein